jgi:hypothetical protein
LIAILHPLEETQLRHDAKHIDVEMFVTHVNCKVSSKVLQETADLVLQIALDLERVVSGRCGSSPSLPSRRRRRARASCDPQRRSGPDGQCVGGDLRLHGRGDPLRVPARGPARPVRTSLPIGSRPRR